MNRSIGTSRLLAATVHDDGANAWESARFAPAPALAGDIQAYGDYRERTGGFTVRRELPHAEGVLIVNLGEPIDITGGDGATLSLGAGCAFVAGVHLHPAFSSSGGTQAGIHVHLPLATLRRLLDVPMDDLVDRVAPLDALLGAPARELGARLCEAQDRESRVALLDAALADRLAKVPRPGRQLAHGLHLLRADPARDIADVARTVGWSRKHFAARVEDAVGVGPRCFRRLLRFQALTGLVAKTARPDWATLALDAGYCDQSHMIREFREFAGMTPRDFVARSLPDGGGLVEA
jgi:AraC-like DNA-binding protein